MLDVDYGETLSLEDARKSARGALDDLFRLTDRNKDDAITREETISASWEGARALGRSAFASADGNSDKYLSPEEFQTAISKSSKPLFDLADFGPTDTAQRLRGLPKR